MSSNRADTASTGIYTSGGSDHHLWQNFYGNQSVTVSSKTYRYFPFEWSGIGESVAIGEQTVELTLPATSLAISAFEAAFASKHLCQIQTFEFDARFGVLAPQTAQVEIGAFLGYVLQMNGSLTKLSVQLGASIAPIGALIPSRTATNDLVGVPCQL